MRIRKAIVLTRGPAGPRVNFAAGLPGDSFCRGVCNIVLWAIPGAGC